MSGGRLEREVIAGELKNVKPMTKLRRERYLRSWLGMAELLSMTVRTDEQRSGDFKGGSESLGCVRKERERVSKHGRRGNRHGASHLVSYWLDGALDGSLHSAGEATIEGRHGIFGRRGRKGKASG